MAPSSGVGKGATARALWWSFVPPAKSLMWVPKRGPSPSHPETGSQVQYEFCVLVTFFMVAFSHVQLTCRLDWVVGAGTWMGWNVISGCVCEVFSDERSIWRHSILKQMVLANEGGYYLILSDLDGTKGGWGFTWPSLSDCFSWDIQLLSWPQLRNRTLPFLILTAVKSD